ncbi:MAG: hypothetical protein EOO09_20500 [Chitinophagaceae bacterium]|nr:MAG: hypothetical protein EOO09_20500 [Chitinophagaceae bacterium]
MPYQFFNTSGTKETFTNTYWVDADAAETIAQVSVSDKVDQVSPAAELRPSYNINGIRIILIAAGNPVVITGRFAHVPDHELSLQQAMEKYGLKEGDFKKME